MEYTLSNAMEQIVKKVLLRHGLLGRGVLLAHSGGLDSTCLLRLLHALNKAGGVAELQVAHIDHGLRPSSVEDAAASCALAAKLGVRHHLVTLAPGKLEGAGNVQQAARRARRKALEKIARDEGLEAIALAQHADDQAETSLFRILRGAGARGAAGMREWSPPYLRPLLSVRRSELEGLASKLGWDFVTDPTNESPKYSRNRVRHELMTLAREIVPGADGALVRFAGLIGEDDDYMTGVAHVELERLARKVPEGLALTVDALRELAPPIRRRLFLAALEEAGGETPPVELEHLKQIEELLGAVSTGKQAPLPGPAIVARTSAELWFASREFLAALEPRLPRLGVDAGLISEGSDEVPPPGALVAVLEGQVSPEELCFNPKSPGDRLLKGGKPRKIKDLLMRLALPSWRRELTVIASRNGDEGPVKLAAFAPGYALVKASEQAPGDASSSWGDRALLWVSADWWMR